MTKRLVYNFYMWNGQQSLEDVMCSICGISVEMCAICENFMQLFPLVVIKYEKDRLVWLY